MAVNVRVLFFGATASVVGSRNLEISLPESSPLIAGLNKVRDDYPGLNNHKLLYSLNQTYATGSEILRDGDELAICTAVSGG